MESDHQISVSPAASNTAEIAVENGSLPVAPVCVFAQVSSEPTPRRRLAALFLLQFHWNVHIEHRHGVLDALGVAFDGRNVRLLAVLTKGGGVSGQFVDVFAEFADCVAVPVFGVRHG